jgi:hypothetical protein
MKIEIKRILFLLGFISILLGSAFFMYTNFVANKPKITIKEQRTAYDRLKADSSIKSQQGYKK